MNLICPCCHAVYPIEAALNDLAGRQAIVEAFKLTTFGDLLLGYVKLFTPPKRALSNMRMGKLLEELLPLIRAASIERNGRVLNAPQDYWRMALAEMLAKRDGGTLTLPLKSHGYLLTIIEGYNLKAEARKEQQHEDQLAGRTPVGSPRPQAGEGLGERVPVKPRSEIPESAKAELKKLNLKPREYNAGDRYE
jgi:hypothetical protein